MRRVPSGSIRVARGSSTSRPRSRRAPPPEPLSRPSATGWIKRGPEVRPGHRGLEGGSSAKDRAVVAPAPDNLQAYWQPISVEAAWDSCRRLTGQVEGKCERGPVE